MTLIAELVALNFCKKHILARAITRKDGGVEPPPCPRGRAPHCGGMVEGGWGRLLPVRYHISRERASRHSTTEWATHLTTVAPMTAADGGSRLSSGRCHRALSQGNFEQRSFCLSETIEFCFENPLNTDS
ncbi:hypothetical protein R5R35_009301 [Gryllus longicercus]|uniref:Uncharacterized protein n=1 Tax=Gryllus longicercus TaxID=2509291 RepID=A0AAN9W347_9ORTH